MRVGGHHAHRDTASPVVTEEIDGAVFRHDHVQGGGEPGRVFLFRGAEPRRGNTAEPGQLWGDDPTIGVEPAKFGDEWLPDHRSLRVAVESDHHRKRHDAAAFFKSVPAKAPVCWPWSMKICPLTMV